MVNGVLGYPKVGAIADSMLTLKEKVDYLMKGHMKEVYLSGCFKAISFGPTTYHLSVNEFLMFIKKWMKQNKYFAALLAAEQGYAELPKIEHLCCPREEGHKHTVKDLAGRVRCAHFEEFQLKQGEISTYKSYDTYSEMDEIEYVVQNWSEEKLPNIVRDVCYAIISEKDYTLSLEKVIRRLNKEPEIKKVYCVNPSACPEDKQHLRICPGHPEPNNVVSFDCASPNLAVYVRKWYEQVNAPLFEKDRVLL
jgi:hypothetical protein